MTETTFESLGVHSWAAKQCAALAMTTPTEVQRRCIPQILKAKHVVGGAVTGSGKTAAFLLPILQILAEEVYGVFAVVMTPSRELAYQILDQVIALGAPIAVRTALAIGGTPHDKQLDAIVSRPHIVVATPGRMKFLLEMFPEVKQALMNLRFLVLDEADRLTEGDIASDTLAVAELLGTPKPFRRTLLFTATVESRLTKVEEGLLPLLGVKDAKELAVCIHASTDSGAVVTREAEGEEGSSSSPLSSSGASNNNNNNRFQVAPNLSQAYLFMPNTVKLPYLVALLKSRSPTSSTIIFVNSCIRCETVRLVLQLLGFPVCSLNSLLQQNHRLTNLALFKSGITRILVATDIAARGLDIPEVDLVAHYDISKEPATYIHRVGRTARAGKSGLSVALITDHDIHLVHRIERITKSRMHLLKNKKVSDDVVVGLLDDVSSAKVQATVQVAEQFGDRAQSLKEVAAERRPMMNKALRGQKPPSIPPQSSSSSSSSSSKKAPPATEGGSATSNNNNNKRPTKRPRDEKDPASSKSSPKDSGRSLKKKNTSV